MHRLFKKYLDLDEEKLLILIKKELDILKLVSANPDLAKQADNQIDQIDKIAEASNLETRRKIFFKVGLLVENYAVGKTNPHGIFSKVVQGQVCKELQAIIDLGQAKANHKSLEQKPVPAHFKR